MTMTAKPTIDRGPSLNGEESARTVTERDPLIGNRSSALENGDGEFASVADSLEPRLPKWNDPPINKWRLAATFYCFVILGINDAAYGVRYSLLEWNLIPYNMIEWYH